MRHTASRRRLGVTSLLVVVMALCAAPARASDILLPGFDLFDPLPGSKFFVPGVGLIPFVGEPLKSFDFGPGFGTFPTGSTDTIVRRIDQADAPFDTIAIELVAMQMVSVEPFDAGLGSGIHYFTLQAIPSPGTMTFTDFGGSHVAPPPTPHGFVEYDSISVNWELRFGSLGGPVALTGTTVLSSLSIPWSHFATPTGAVIIPGINNVGFFPIDTFAWTSGDGTRITLRTAPEPSAMLMLALSAAAFAVRARRRRS